MKSKLKTITMVDPPSGWRYGFPKELPEGVTDIMSWLTESGYPKHAIESFGESFPYRVFQMEVDGNVICVNNDYGNGISNKDFKSKKKQ